MELPDIANLDYGQLAQLRKNIGERMTEMRETAIVQLRATIAEQATLLNVPLEDLMPRKSKGPGKNGGAKRYQDPDNPENTYAGKGPKPQWLKIALDEGAKLEDFAI